MSEAITKPQHWDHWIHTEASALVAALPVTIADEDLKRARARLKLAFQALPPDSPIYKCRAASVVNCLAMSAMTGLFPGGLNPDVYLIPRKSKKHGYALMLNWQISYRGHIRLCRRTDGWDIQAVPIFKEDTFMRRRSSAEGHVYEHVPKYDSGADPAADWEELRGVLVIVQSPGREKWAFLSRGEIAKRRAKAEYDDNWKEWPIERAMGTACAWAGQREMFPTDDPTRYALNGDPAPDPVSSGPKVSLLPAFTDEPKFPPVSDIHDDDAPIPPEVEAQLIEQALKRDADEVAATESKQQEIPQ